ncbi:MAG TPA: hypothetical protein VI728_10565 [Syntrophales bacterium]|nr:hypothetical protein [Syntrophales bacterium]
MNSIMAYISSHPLNVMAGTCINLFIFYLIFKKHVSLTSRWIEAKESDGPECVFL